MIRTHVMRGEETMCGVSLADALKPHPEASVWLDFEDPTPAELALLTEHFGFHPLAVEDCVHHQRRAKLERYQTHAFVVLCALDRTTRHDILDTTPVCVFLRPRLVVTVHPKRTTAVDRVLALAEREPDRAGHRPDRVLHALMDAVVDELLPILDDWEDHLDDLAAHALRTDEPGLMRKLTLVRRDILTMRRLVLPLVEVARRLVDDAAPEVSPDQRVYFRDVQDHVLAVSEMASLLLDVVNGAVNAQATAVNERTNEVMKFLAIVSTLMLPWTVVGGLFGMNFDIIPFAHHPWGFGLALLAMLGFSAALLVYVRRRGWFSITGRR